MLNVQNAAVDFFKRCSLCHNTWTHRRDFLQDPDVEMIGYQANYENQKRGLFYFNHNLKVCHTTLAIMTKDFIDLYEGRIHEIRLTGTESCPMYCQDKENLEPCNAECEMAHVREVVQIVKGWPKLGGL